MSMRIKHGYLEAFWIVLIAIGSQAVSADDFSHADWRARIQDESNVNEIATLYVHYLAHVNPVFGTQIGLHGPASDPFSFDGRLPDMSADAWLDDYHTHLFLREFLAGMNPAAMSRDDRVDHHILQYEVEQQILSMTVLGAMTDPLTYVTQLGGAFNSLILRDYAPLAGRLESFGKRCAATARYLEQSRDALMPPYVRPTQLQKATAIARLEGMTREGGLFDKTLASLLRTGGVKPVQVDGIGRACKDAVGHIDAFRAWFEAEILPRPDGEWRLGRELYAQKYHYYMDYPLGPDELLATAELELESRYGALVETARRIHDAYLRAEIERGDVKSSANLADRDVAQNVFDKLAQDRPTVETLIDESYAMADAIVAFVERMNLLSLPPSAKLRIEEIPAHLSGYAVAQIQTAPPFEPDLESVWFWDLALLAASDDYLKEYNHATLAQVYIHEGVPGHFVQLTYSNASERVAPKVFGNGPMIEGWASYIETQLVDQGFTVYPDLLYGRELQQLVNHKLRLRGVINTIIDIKLHTQGWPGEDAVALMIDKGFQEESEARGKLARAQLSSVQLATYFAGRSAIVEILAEYRAMQGAAFTWKAFNERLIGAGSPPFFALREYMLQAR